MIARRLVLRYVAVVDFRKNELTNYEEFKKAEPALAEVLKGDDVVCFVSQTGTQLCFVYGFTDVRDPNFKGEDPHRHIIASAKLRVTNGRWSPALLADYAKRVKIELAHLKTFEEVLRERRAVEASAA